MAAVPFFALGVLAAAQAETVETASKWAEAFLSGKTAALWSLMTPDLRAAIGSEEAFARLHDQVTESFGTEVDVVSEKVHRDNGTVIYARVSEWSETDQRLSIRITLTAQNRISGFLVQPVSKVAKSQFLDYKTKAELHLPFDGEWTVFWGGRSIEDNYHAANPAQRFATDFVVSRNGRTHEGDGAALEDYYCWGRPILAPADGTVVAVTDGLPDQRIGSRDPENPAGNHVVIDFGEQEYGFLAHLKAGSVAVSEGQEITRGQEVGRCGNSGNSSEPHLHFHLQTTADLNDGDGLPAQFVSYLADGARIERGEPRKGQIISDGN